MSDDFEPETRCLWDALRTCRAQHCGRAIYPFELPFCGTCLDLLPRLVRERLEEEWLEPVMCEIEEPEFQTRVGRRTGVRFQVATGRTVKRMVRDIDGEIAKHLRMEIRVAWMLRALRRKGVIPLRGRAMISSVEDDRPMA